MDIILTLTYVLHALLHGWTKGPILQFGKVYKQGCHQLNLIAGKVNREMALN